MEIGDRAFVSEIERRSQQQIGLCFHCHKCTGGCPVAGEMLYGPDRILRLIQLGEKERLLRSHDIWLCASCEMCGARCPNGINVGAVMDSLRQLALQEETCVAAPDTVRFHRLFLTLVERLGRMHEASLLGVYLVWTRQVLGYARTGASMFLKGKVPLRPHRAGDRHQLQRIFAETEEK